jgi:hypothetical protein
MPIRASRSCVRGGAGIAVESAGDGSMAAKGMQVMAESAGLARRSARGMTRETMPEPIRRPPGRPPQEPIIKVPTRAPETPEIDRSEDDEDEEAEIRTPPGIVPEQPPPPRPEERAVGSHSVAEDCVGCVAARPRRAQMLGLVVGAAGIEPATPTMST